MTDQSPRNRHAANIALMIGGVVTAIAVLVLLGWLLRVPWMVQLIPGTVAMVFSNAACILLLGVALLLTGVERRWSRPVQVVIGVAVLGVGVTVLVQYRFGLALPLDLPGLHNWLQGNPGRMAPNTALAHALAGLTVLLVVTARPGRRSLAALAGAFAVILLGVVGIAGYRLRPELLYGWHIETRMALHTGAAFVLIGTGYALAVYRAQRMQDLFRQREDLRVGLLGGGLMVFVGLLGGMAAFALMQEQLVVTQRQGLLQSYQSRRDLIAAELNSAMQSARDFASRPGIERELDRLRSAPDDSAARHYIETALQRHIAEGKGGARIYDSRGRLVAGVGVLPTGPVALPLQVPAATVLQWNGQVVSLRVQQVIVARGRPVGRFEAAYPLPGITHLHTDVAGFGASSDMQLCARAGEAIRCLPTVLHPERTELPAATRAGPTLITRALASEHDVGFGMDYRGQQVIAAYGPVADTWLGLVLKVDVDEIFSPVRKRFELALLAIAMVVTIGILLLRARLVPLVRRLALSEKRVRGLLEAAPDAMVVTDPDGRIVWVNAQAERMFGYALAELSGQPVEILVPEQFRSHHSALRAEYGREPRLRKTGPGLELSGRRKDGSTFPVEISLSPQETEEGLRVISTVRDISERQHALQQLRDSEQRWQFALEGARDGVWDWNIGTNEVFFSRQWKRMLGFEEHEIGNSLAEWDRRVHPDDKARTYADIEKHIKGEAPYYENEHRVLCKDGTYKWILDRGMVVARDAGGQPTRMIGTHTDIAARKQAEETIRELSLADELTGLRNRRGFMILGEAQLMIAHRLGSRVMLYFADLDGFKRINDEFGHVEGDRALADFAAILRTLVRESDILARLGGDEFVVLALESPGVHAEALVERLTEALQQFNTRHGRPYRLAASIGVAERAPGSTESLADLLKRADADMYRVKQQHRAVSGPDR